MLRQLKRLSHWYWLAKSQVIYRPFLGALGSRSRFIKPLQLRNPQNLYLGNNVCIGAHTWIITLPLSTDRAPRLVIGDGTQIGNFNHIACVNSLEIGRKVLTADRVYISDHLHGFEDISKPVMDQPLVSRGPVVIGAGSWLGENVVVLSCSIGRNCVIGANAVVTKDIPDFCVAAGVPARVIRRFNQQTGKWEKT